MSVADVVEPLVRAGLGGALPVRLRCWDGSEINPPGALVRLTFTNPRALRRMLWAPNELGFARAYVSGDVLIEGDIMEGLTALEQVADPDFGPGVVVDSSTRRALVKAALRLGSPVRHPVHRQRSQGWAGFAIPGAGTPRPSPTTMTSATSSTSWFSGRR